MSAVDPASEITPALFRRVMGAFATGVTVVTATAGGETRGMTANAFMSGSLEPPLCVISVALRATMHDHLVQAGTFAINVLSSAQLDLAAHFGGRPIAELGVGYPLVGGIPTIADTAACITAETTARYPCGDHTLFVGRIRSMTTGVRAPLLFHGGRYATLFPDSHLPLAPELE